MPTKHPFPPTLGPLALLHHPERPEATEFPEKKILAQPTTNNFRLFLKKVRVFFPEREKDESSGLLRAALEQKTAATFRKKLRGTFRDSGRALRAGPWKLGLKNSRCVRIAFPTKQFRNLKRICFFPDCLYGQWNFFSEVGALQVSGWEEFRYKL